MSSCFPILWGSFLCSFSGALATSELIEVNSPSTSVPNNTTLPSNSTVVVSDGGTIGLGVDLSNSTFLIEGGEVALGANTISTGFSNTNNEILATGGQVGGFFQIREGSSLNLSGGTIESFGVFNGGSADVFSGQVLRFPDIWAGAVVRVFGGDLFSVRVFQTGEVHFFGSQFALNGELITDLSPNEARVISARNVTLSGLLTDGSPLSFDLNTTAGSFFGSNPDGAASTATITVTLVSQQGSSATISSTQSEFTSTRAGSIQVPSQTGHLYRLRRTTDLQSLGAIIAIQEGTGEELSFSFDDSATDEERAFFLVEEVPAD